MKVSIEWLYKVPKSNSLMLRSDELDVHEAIKAAKDIERTGRVKWLKLIDEHNDEWSVKKLERYIMELDKEPHDLEVYFDGSYDLTTSQAGGGVVIYYTQGSIRRRIRKNGILEQITSNNEAEYAALHLALTELELMGVHHLPVIIRGDSQVVIQQLQGEWAVFDKEHNRWIDRIEEKLQAMKLKPTYELVERKLNDEADQLAHQSLKGIEIESEMTII
ncbi:reverse transcriptase-like protein [Bacillus solimangrovi]|uniref:RNase H type-1 domain-containing protein n=1 Tax=Bacillus solimangrovi TaxID=1305675 RepID=A0A1E5LFJ3_9BACI|nr:reverse transcriptase-like protein [Bacillus solimangrovi]OEH92849.1 hypothetical protein BFG57_02315 [Bacillus solimangrovi]